jgi:hypothetical protein
LAIDQARLSQAQAKLAADQNKLLVSDQKTLNASAGLALPFLAEL